MRVWIRSIVVVVAVAVALQIDKDVTIFPSVVYSVLLEISAVKFLYNPSRMNLN